MAARLTIPETLAVAQANAFMLPGLVTIVAIAIAESGLDPRARLTDADGSVDRGILQMNSHAHAEVTDQCADDPDCAFRHGYIISRSGTDFTPWSTYKNGAYKQHLAEVLHALGPQTPTVAARRHLDRPFAGQPVVTQGFGLTVVAAEPRGYLFPDGTVSYYHPGGVLHDHLHSGVDYAIADGTPLRAGAAGTVLTAELDTTGYGLCLKIDHGPVTSLYAHLTDIVVRPGDRVTAGQLVAHSGGDPAHEPNSGNSSGPHLHFSTIDTTLTPARYRDPAQYILSPGPAPAPEHVGDPYHVLATPVQLHTQKDADPHRVFRDASTQSRRLTTLVPGFAVMVVAWTSAGEPVFDKEAKRVDAVWYEVHLPSLADTGWMPSARIEGTVPGAPG